MRRKLAVALAWLAAAALLLGAWLGSFERRSLSEVVPAGPLAGVPQGSVRAVEVRHEGRRWRFERDGDAWRTAPDARALDLALTLLRNAAVERRFERGEAPDDASAGLAPPRLSVAIEATQRLAIDFGASNATGFARYARIRGDTLLVPGYVADAWEAAVGLRAPIDDGQADPLLSDGLAGVQAVELNRNRQTVRFERDADGRWFEHRHVGLDLSLANAHRHGSAADHRHDVDAAASASIETALASFARARTKRWIGHLAPLAPEYGLVEPLLRASVFKASALPVLRIEVGDTAPEGGRYAYWPERDAIVVLPKEAIEQLVALLDRGHKP